MQEHIVNLKKASERLKTAAFHLKMEIPVFPVRSQIPWSHNRLERNPTTTRLTQGDR